MKKYLTAVALVALLSGCDNASKAIEQAQDKANKAVDTLQTKIESVDMSKLNLEKLGTAKESAKEFAASLDEALQTDFSDPEKLAKAKERIANAYSCLVEASSEGTARQLIDTIKEGISNEEARALIEGGIEKAQTVRACVTAKA